MRNRSIALAAVLLLAGVCQASDSLNAEFNPATWAQGGPYSVANLKDKVVMLVYFDEG